MENVAHAALRAAYARLVLDAAHLEDSPAVEAAFAFKPSKGGGWEPPMK